MDEIKEINENWRDNLNKNKKCTIFMIKIMKKIHVASKQRDIPY